MGGWLFVMYGGIDPGEAIGPWETEEEMESLILEEMRENSDLLHEDGTDTIHSIRFTEIGKPLIGAFSCGYMDDLRARVNAEQEGVCRSES